MDSSALDLILVISLSILAFCLLVFLFFFVPILIQLNKAMESVNSLLDLLNDYARGAKNELSKTFNSLSDNLKHAGGHVLDFALSLKDTLIEAFKK